MYCESQAELILKRLPVSISTFLNKAFPEATTTDRINAVVASEDSVDISHGKQLDLNVVLEFDEAIQGFLYFGFTVVFWHVRWYCPRMSKLFCSEKKNVFEYYYT